MKETQRLQRRSMNKRFVYAMVVYGLLSFVPSSAVASNIVLSNSFNDISSTIAIGEQWYMDVLINTDNESINGIEGVLQYTPELLSVVRIENASSVVGMWYKEPNVSSVGTIEFGGIMPNGFSGLIDPFDESQKKPGKLFRVVFVGISSGQASISSVDVIGSINDGNGTIFDLANNSTDITIKNENSESTYTTEDKIKPVLNASRIRDPLLYDNQWVIIFTASDQQSGVATIQVQENSGEWNDAVSPYLVQDQTLKGIIRVRAIDNVGNITTVTVNYIKKTFILYVFLVFVGTVVLIRYRKKIFK